MSDLEIVPACTKSSMFNNFVFLPLSLLSEESTSSKSGLEEMEQLYLQICCEVPPSITPGSHQPLDEPSADSQFAVVPLHRNKLEQLLLGVANHLLDCYSPDVSQACRSVYLCRPKICTNQIKTFFQSLQSQSCPPECVVRCCGLLTGVLAAYVSTGCLTEEEAVRSPLFAKARVRF